MKLNKHRDDGTVDKKKILSSSFAVFTKKYTITKDVRTILSTWPDSEYRQQMPFKELKATVRVQSILCDLCDSTDLPNIEIQEKPRSGIFAKENYLTGQLKIVPFGKVSLIDAEEDVHPTCFEVKGKVVADKICFIRLIPSTEEETNPLTFIRYVDTDEEEATAKIEYKHLKLANGGAKVSMPIVTNCSKLKIGGEITLPNLKKTSGNEETKTKVKRNVMVSCVNTNKKARASTDI